MVKFPSNKKTLTETAREVEDERSERDNGGRVETAITVRGDFGVDDPGDFVPVKYVTVPMLEVPVGATFIAQMVDAMRVLPPLEGQTRKIKGDHVASTIRSTTGAVRLFTWNTVFRSEMEKVYEDAGYVGKWFQITKLAMKRGKDYHTFAITEVAPRASAAS